MPRYDMYLQGGCGAVGRRPSPPGAGPGAGTAWTVLAPGTRRETQTGTGRNAWTAAVPLPWPSFTAESQTQT